MNLPGSQGGMKIQAIFVRNRVAMYQALISKKIKSEKLKLGRKQSM